MLVEPLGRRTSRQSKRAYWACDFGRRFFAPPDRVARTGGLAGNRTWLILNVSQKKVKPVVLDWKKYIAGWIVIALAGVAAILCLTRDAAGSVIWCAFMAYIGWALVSEAKIRREQSSRKRFRWFHCALIVALLMCGVLLGYFATLP
jgi:small-conductance mechanosensitive channel